MKACGDGKCGSVVVIDGETHTHRFLPFRVPGVFRQSDHSMEGSVQSVKLSDKVFAKLKVIIW